MTLTGRLREWNAIRKVRPLEELGDVGGGRDGEAALRRMVGTSREFHDARVFTGRRVPSRRQGRRREIDLIVCTPRRIHLIEVKNWSGNLALQRGDWIQTRRGGDVVNHGDLLRTNLQKREAVAEYLHDRGMALDDRFVSRFVLPQIIFMNPHLTLDPAIERLPEVITRRSLDGFLGKQAESPFGERLLNSLASLCLDAVGAGEAERIPEGTYRRVAGLLSEVGTWDQLQLYGSRVLAGDVVRLQVGDRFTNKLELIGEAGRMPIRLKWTRGGFWGFLKALTGFGALGTLFLGKTKRSVTHRDTVTFHAVGDEAPTTRSLAEVEGIVVDAT